MFYLSKILPFFVLPLGITFLLLGAAFFLRRRSLVMIAAVLLYLSSLPLTGRLALSAVESGMERLPASTASEAEAIVVLSGARSIAPGVAKVSEWTDADRFFGGLELFKAGKAPLLVFTGGWVPSEPDAPTEGEILVEYAKAFGIPGDATRTTGKVKNTAEEASALAEMLGAGPSSSRKPKILLVTSAFHIPRAGSQFEAAGFEVEPFPVDFLVSVERRIDILDFIPSPTALSQTSMVIREFYGRAFVAIFN